MSSHWAAVAPHNGLELSCPAEAGGPHLIVAHAGAPGTPPYAPARRVSFSELLGAILHMCIGVVIGHEVEVDPMLQVGLASGKHETEAFH